MKQKCVGVDFWSLNETEFCSSPRGNAVMIKEEKQSGSDSFNHQRKRAGQEEVQQNRSYCCPTSGTPPLPHNSPLLTGGFGLSPVG